MSSTVVSEPTILLVKERVVSNQTDPVLNAATGEPYFQMRGALQKKVGRRELLDKNGNVVFGLTYQSSSLFSKGQWYITGAAGQPVATMKQLSRYSFNLNGTLADGRRITVTEGTGSLQKQRTAVIQDQNGDILAIKRGPAQGSGFPGHNDGYVVLEVRPGSDAGVAVMLLALLDEMKSGALRRDPQLLLYYH